MSPKNGLSSASSVVFRTYMGMLPKAMTKSGLAIAPSGYTTKIRVALPLHYIHSEDSFKAVRERINEETKGLFTYRIADRRGDHPDHRGHRNPEPAACPHFGERIVCRG